MDDGYVLFGKVGEFTEFVQPNCKPSTQGEVDSVVVAEYMGDSFQQIDDVELFSRS